MCMLDAGRQKDAETPNKPSRETSERVESAQKGSVSSEALRASNRFQEACLDVISCATAWMLNLNGSVVIMFATDTVIMMIEVAVAIEMRDNTGDKNGGSSLCIVGFLDELLCATEKHRCQKQSPYKYHRYDICNNYVVSWQLSSVLHYIRNRPHHHHIINIRDSIPGPLH